MSAELVKTLGENHEYSISCALLLYQVLVPFTKFPLVSRILAKRDKYFYMAVRRNKMSIILKNFLDDHKHVHYVTKILNPFFS